ncbi:MAG: DegT/DnrJ/EryC1/StrS family aminotransferase [Methanobrevibacter sp.]|uniref:DegT/DnrJ/EryC1/StrS family aminotransferase n=1 Tax=Methanobrevibacter sp. TaxID=66852 RepID=UPI0026E0281E|nr:DegT/DnrJ/EryC1/StrS family aminotransferase [Methanobrevibacter sp.]MDO5848983.1 DegT/DnrJ/EryC1/StrS family aminotransferase [Methanobrevibacter sp.]
MTFKFKEPSLKTKETMADVALNGASKNYEESIVSKIKGHTGHENVRVTNSGNASIFIALSGVGENIIIPDQGAWNGFKQVANLLNKNITILKTEQGIIDSEDIEELENNSSLILTSFAGYSGEQNLKEISEACKEKSITIIEDASAGIGDRKKRLGNGEYSDIILTSTGSPKIINAGSGGIISTNNREIFENTKIQQKIVKPNEIILSGIDVELDNIEKKLENTINACSYLKNNLDNVIHQDKRGLNVIIKDQKPKDLSWNLKHELEINKSGFITKCPNYNRVKEKAVAIEIKNLDYCCLTKEKLDLIIEKVEKFKNQ